MSSSKAKWMGLKCVVCHNAGATFVQLGDECKCKGKMCLACVKVMATLDGSLKCPTCRLKCDKYTPVRIPAAAQPVATLVARLQGGAAGGAHIHALHSIAGISATDDGNVYYLAVWKMKRGELGKLPTSWEPASELDECNIVEFHKRFCVPLVSDATFVYPYEFEHGVPKAQLDASGALEFICSNCVKAFSNHNKAMDHIRSSHAGARFKCRPCNASYTKRDKLKAHVEKVHNAPVRAAAAGRATFGLPPGAAVTMATLLPEPGAAMVKAVVIPMASSAAAAFYARHAAVAVQAEAALEIPVPVDAPVELVAAEAEVPRVAPAVSHVGAAAFLARRQERINILMANAARDHAPAIAAAAAPHQQVIDVSNDEEGVDELMEAQRARDEELGLIPQVAEQLL